MFYSFFISVFVFVIVFVIIPTLAQMFYLFLLVLFFPRYRLRPLSSSFSFKFRNIAKTFAYLEKNDYFCKTKYSHFFTSDYLPFF